MLSGLFLINHSLDDTQRLEMMVNQLFLLGVRIILYLMMLLIFLKKCDSIIVTYQVLFLSFLFDRT